MADTLGSVLRKLDELAATMTADERAVLADILNDDDAAGYSGIWPGTKQLIGNTRLQQLTPPPKGPQLMGAEAGDSGI